MKAKHFLTLKDVSQETIDYMLKLATRLKKNKFLFRDLLQGKSIGLLFDKHSTRTRLSFEAGINQLGGNSIYLDSKNMQLSRGETVEDTARVLSRYLDGLVIRTFAHQRVEDFASNSSIPVINGLTDSYHPCQILSDMFTLFELGLLNKSLKFTYVGDSNNVANSLLIGFSKLGLDITVGCPQEYAPPEWVVELFRKEAKKSGSMLRIINDPFKAVEGADVIYTDVWISMGDKDSSEKVKKLEKFQVNGRMLECASDSAKVMHCLPAHRGQEITSDIMDGKHSVVWQQAENRLHAQKALLAYIYSR
ncbi:MAG: ornithine carbamoyltransferase [Actinomycetota bacterium]